MRTWVLLLEARYGDAGVVVDAEAARPRAHGVVQPAGDAHRVICLPAHDDAARLEQHRTYDAGCGVVHVGEDRVVPRETVVHKLGETPAPRPAFCTRRT